MTDRIARYLAETAPPTPCLILDLDVVRAKYEDLRSALPSAEIFYAVKANPAPEILSLLVALGARFDVASRAEIDLCLAAGAAPDRLSFGNTIKKASDIAHAHACGVRIFAFDAVEELEKIAMHAPGASVFCRIQTSNAGADWPLSRKFGCAADMARDLLLRAKTLSLDPFGLSFHVGSQQRDVDAWDAAVGAARAVFAELEALGAPLRMVNLGGGFPSQYRDGAPCALDYGLAITRAMTKHFGNNLPQTVVEPGRYLVGDAGVIQTEVVLVSRKGYDDPKRWVYLDIGRFGGLAEAEGEAIRYRIEAEREGGEDGPVVLAGPTCDSADVLYERTAYSMPLDLKAGDRLRIHAAGAYTTTYASVGFNGFAPLQQYVI